MRVPAQVLVIGPPPTLLGGMSTVVSQIIGLDFAERYRISSFPFTFSPKAGERGAAKIYRHIRHRMRLGQRLRAKPAICHIHTCSGFSFHRNAWDLQIARRHGCKTILHMHGAQFEDYFAQAPGWERWRIRGVLESADRVVALSESWKQKLLAMAPKASMAVIENAVDVSNSLERTASPRCRFLMLSRMDQWKGVDDLLDACALVMRQGISCQVTLAGPSGSAGDRPAIDVKIRERGLQGFVSYVGPVEGESRAECFAKSDVLIQPSHHEGLPMAILEAFAQGIPVIATRVGAVPEIMIHGEHGLLAPPRLPEALAAAMCRLAIDPPTRQSMGRSASQLAATRFSIARFREDLLALYDGLLRQDPHRSLEPALVRASAARSPIEEAELVRVL